MTLIYFPWMHTELLPGLPGAQVCLLDPGLDQGGAGQGAPGFWQPAGLPLQGERAQAYLQQVRSLALQYRDPKELTLQAWDGKPPLFAQTSAALASEFRQRLDPEQEGKSEATQDYALQAQMVLLLAWDLEEQTLEQGRLEQNLEDKWQSLQDMLGADEEQPDYFPSGGLFRKGTAPAMELASWPGLLAWFLFFVQPVDWLYVDLDWIYQEWQEQGLLPEALLPEEERELGLQEGTGKWKRLRAKGRDLVLGSSGKKDKPWLEQEYKVLLPTG
ncbi:MAG: hypothetical protein R6U22_10115 [Desulfohalobiaceae bacterium]